MHLARAVVYLAGNFIRGCIFLAVWTTPLPFPGLRFAWGRVDKAFTTSRMPALVIPVYLSIIKVFIPPGRFSGTRDFITNIVIIIIIVIIVMPRRRIKRAEIIDGIYKSALPPN